MQNKNAHVTQKEVPFPPGKVLISKTDIKGIITYANDAFVAISGYTREELLGKNHNIVRHPDMPPQAFKWLWNTLKAGRPWRGVVKNRSKNGDHYWVRATIAPIIENGSITGYVSVRRPPTREQVTDAEALYRKLNASGAPVMSKYERLKFKNWPLTAKMQLLIQATLIIVLSMAQVYISSNLRSESKLLATEKGEQLANEIIDSSNMLMVTGQIGDAGNRQLLIKKIDSSSDVKSAQIVRTKPVVDMYGPGLAEEQIKDEVQRQVIESKQQSVAFTKDANGLPILRVVTPVVASKDFHGTDCTGCHAVAEGTVLGATDVVIDMKPDYDRIHRMEMQTIGGQIALHIFLFFFIGYCVNRYVDRPANAVKREFRNVMEGNLDSELDISIWDEMGFLLCEIQTMQTYLRTMVDEIVTPVAQIQKRIEDMDARVSGVADNAVTEQDHIQQIASTMEEFSQSVAEVANMADDSLKDARAMQKIVEENNRNMELSIAATSKVSDTVQSSSKTISDLGASIEKIGVIANAIKDIADQTNLLALNAAIEAARAGEQGRGFAVVADEVRKLAERTATSTKDIAKTIGEINAISEAAVQSMHGAVSEVESSIGLIRKNGEGLKEIMSASVNVAERVDHIAMASREQSAAGESVANSLERITGLVDNNTHSAKDAKAAAEELASSADELRKAGYPLTKCGLG
ncbi:methyl-accepting chemotaxis protein [Ferrigenium kumadai]|uniref:Methyl-accepting chemotaxis protein n=1 Tax=Ferrigenium kumadai TaxID=1682490 RepID=A0AAN1SXK0_9PROT|nr:methyl-accepting chemotaxis protein [Ferrigenium kumadai]BBI98738.1 methyl-accepting chemotaxis protein [Ferrigenium kumadai]